MGWSRGGIRRKLRVTREHQHFVTAVSFFSVKTRQIESSVHPWEKTRSIHNDASKWFLSSSAHAVKYCSKTRSGDWGESETNLPSPVIYFLFTGGSSLLLATGSINFVAVVVSIFSGWEKKRDFIIRSKREQKLGGRRRRQTLISFRFKEKSWNQMILRK